MALRVGIALAICAGMATTVAAQVVRFETSVGEFDMVLNPTNSPVLQANVDNLLYYVENGDYNGSWINRADQGFVLQMGGFHSHTLRPPMTIASTRPVAAVAPVRGEPAAETGLSNTVGTVAFALPGGAGGTNQDGGTSSFFVNLTSNTFLDADFTVFAAISDMTVINEIMDLMAIDRTADDMFGADPGNLAFTDVPVEENGFQVFIERAFVVSDTTAIARATAGVQSAVQLSAAASGAASTISAATSSVSGGELSSSQIASAAVPEPATGAMLILGTLFMFLRRRARSA